MTYEIMPTTIILYVDGVTMSMSSEFMYELNGNKGQFVRIRYKTGKFRSNSVSILNVTLALFCANFM